MSPTDRHERTRLAYLRAKYQPTWRERISGWIAGAWHCLDAFCSRVRRAVTFWRRK